MKCMDCGVDSKDSGLFMMLSDIQWRLLLSVKNDYQDGFLCATCMAVRAEELPNAYIIRASIEVYPPVEKLEGKENG